MNDGDANLDFLSGGAADTPIRLAAARGRQALNGLFEIELLLSCPGGPLPDETVFAMLRAPAAISLGSTPAAIRHGALASLTQLDAADGSTAVYSAQLVPSLWRLRLARTNAVYKDVDIGGLARGVFDRYGLNEGTHFELRLDGTYERREYVVQYEESDWDFLCRWLEHEGVCSFFAHGENVEKIVLVDAVALADPLPEGDALEYRARSNLRHTADGSVWDWQCEYRPVVRRVVLRDYNYRLPQLDLTASAVADHREGFGSVDFYGDHFKTPEEGARLARVRAERYRTEARTYRGKSDSYRLQAGTLFELRGHPDPRFSARFLVTELAFRVGVRFPDETAVSTEGYSARFSAIREDQPYRPERVTPWPSVHGVLHAHIDADGTGAAAELDELGRYHVRLPFEASGKVGSRASRRIRMAQPYAGAGYGTHFPLHKGTEVLLAHIDGDPDRPVIVGAVPNPRTPSPTTAPNATQSVIQTASGIRIELEDMSR